MSMADQIIRVFPRRTRATPDDELAFVGTPKGGDAPTVCKVHVSCAFSYDLPKAEQLAEAWAKTGRSVAMGGPAFNEPGGEFVPGRYLKPGFVITSRGCPNRCWFCSVPEREGYQIRELPIVDGFNVLDDNLLACSAGHIQAVFDMLARQPERPIFTGGLEARLLKEWHAVALKRVHVKRMYFAYDTPDDYDPLIHAGRLLREAGHTVASHAACCYVLIGYVGDTLEKAERRLIDTIKAGFVPYAMLYRDELGIVPKGWAAFQTQWCYPPIVAAKFRQIRDREASK